MIGDDNSGSKRVRRILFLVAVLAGAAVTAVTAVDHRPVVGPRALQPLDIGAGQRDARLGCDAMTRVEAKVTANASYDAVRRLLDEAVHLTKNAADEDPTWMSLASGVLAVRAGFRDNNGSLTGTGISVVHDQCPRVSFP